MESFGGSILGVFGERLEGLLVDAIACGVEHSVEIFEGSRVYGANANTLGTDMYHYVWNELRKVAQESNGEILVLPREENLDRLGVNGIQLFCYKVVGDTTDIHRSFPRNGRRVPVRLDEQWIPNLGCEPVVSGDEMILAYLATAEDGLIGVYLCIPARAPDGSIERWAEVRELYRTPMLAKDIRPCEVKVPEEPMVRGDNLLKKKAPRRKLERDAE